MQNGSVVRRSRKNHSDIWQFRWSEKTSTARDFTEEERLGQLIRFQTWKLLARLHAFWCRS